MTKTLYLAVPHGFCAGVKRAVDILKKCLKKYGPPIYVNHEIVHNSFLVDYFKEKGVIFDAKLDEIPKNSIYVFSAHGVSPLFREKCEKRNLKIVDATCPLVLRVHREVAYLDKEGYEIFLMGRKNHQEVRGTSGVAKMRVIEEMADIEKINTEKLKNKFTACVTQTTLSLTDTKKFTEKLQQHLPDIKIINDICYASQNRQNAVRETAKKCDFMVVMGSKNSANSNRLVHEATALGCKAELFDHAGEIHEQVFACEKVGITSGASVPENLLNEAIDLFKSENPSLKLEIVHVAEENLNFPLPKL